MTELQKLLYSANDFIKLGVITINAFLREFDFRRVPGKIDMDLPLTNALGVSRGPKLDGCVLLQKN